MREEVNFTNKKEHRSLKWWEKLKAGGKKDAKICKNMQRIFSHIFAFFCIFLHIFAYFRIFLHIFAYRSCHLKPWGLTGPLITLFLAMEAKSLPGEAVKKNGHFETKSRIRLILFYFPSYSSHHVIAFWPLYWSFLILPPHLIFDPYALNCNWWKG